MAIYWGSYRSGQTGLTVNQLAYAYGGSNPPLPTGDHWVARQSQRAQYTRAGVRFPREGVRHAPWQGNRGGCQVATAARQYRRTSHARVAQGQSTILVRLGSWVQSPSRAPTVPPLPATLCVGARA